jgi:ATP-dependent helicase HrpB
MNSTIPEDINLPVSEIILPLKETLLQHHSVIVSAPPGAGKSTLLPLTLLNEAWLGTKKIIMLEPRRLAARGVALRMASLMNEPVGKTIGYRIRFETCVSSETKLEVVTEGILTRMLQSDNALEDVALVIFDEFHERSLHADLALALCLEAQHILRPDLKIMLMSATLQVNELQLFLNAPVLESKGKMFPVDVYHTQDADPILLPELAAETTARAVIKHPGDALVFLPGEAEIRKCEELLKNHLPDFRIHPLYGNLPPGEQYLAIMPNKFGQRKIVLATSIAETSLTIEGIQIVVDSGFGRTSRFDSKSGLSRLETIRISKDSATQRAGRAGRLSKGVCYRMWSEATHSRLAEHRNPEMMEADLCSLLLETYQWGIADVYRLKWLTPPPESSVKQAVETLESIGAIEHGKITAHGKAIHRLSCHPRIAHMLLMANDEQEKQLACDIAAIIEERDPLPKESGIDINLRIEALRRHRSNKGSNNKFKRIAANASYYLKLLNLTENNSPYDPYTTGLLLAYAYPERIAASRPGNNAPFQLANGKIATAGHKDDLAHEQWLAVAHMDLREGLGKIFMAAPINPGDLKELVKEQETISWDSRKGGLYAAKELKIGSIILQSKTLHLPNETKVMEAICKAIRIEGESLLDITETFEQLIIRINCVNDWKAQDDKERVSKDNLFKNAESWLGPYLKNCKRNEDLKKINLHDCLFYSLSIELQNDLNTLAPERIEVPSGSTIRISYQPGGAAPVIAVRLQEVFGLSDTPTVNNGKIKTVIHLLSPGYKPVQVTSDLKSFWNNMYHEVKKEMQRRYPKHSWPDNPWEAKAVAKGRSYK